MFNALEIIRKNNATFYDFNTQKKRSQWPRYGFLCLVSFVAAVICPKVSDNLLSGVLAVQSILLGFTVNVMFFLLGNREKEETGGQSIEAEIRSQRLHKLYHELFYNVSYFNLIAVASIIIATGLLLPTPTVPGFLRELPSVEAYVHWLSTSKVPRLVSGTIRGCAMFLFYAVSIEVVLSIGRVIGRTSFYFERKMRDVRHTER